MNYCMFYYLNKIKIKVWCLHCFFFYCLYIFHIQIIIYCACVLLFAFLLSLLNKNMINLINFSLVRFGMGYGFIYSLFVGMKLYTVELWLMLSLSLLKTDEMFEHIFVFHILSFLYSQWHVQIARIVNTKQPSVNQDIAKRANTNLQQWHFAHSVLT